jgi:hypothetical protein
MALRDIHIIDFAYFDYLLTEEMHNLRRSFGYFWFNKSEIRNLEKKHIVERESINNMLMIKYNSDKSMTDILLDYVKIHPVDRLNNYTKFIKNKKGIYTNDEKFKIKILSKFNKHRYEKTHIFQMSCLEEFRRLLLKSNVKEIIINSSDINTCSICMDSDRQIDLSTECGHHFHRTCFDHWIEQNNICPVCRHSEPELLSVHIRQISLI